MTVKRGEVAVDHRREEIKPLMVMKIKRETGEGMQLTEPIEKNQWW